MKNISLIAFLLFTNFIFAQTAIGAFSTREYHNVENLYYSEYTNEVTGDLYLFEDWKKCVVNTNLKEDGLTLNLVCNYNLFTDQFEMKIDNEIHYLKKENIVSIWNGQNFFKPVSNGEEEETRNYLELLATGNKFDLATVHYLKIKDVPNKKALGIFKKRISKHNKLFLVDKTTGELMEIPKSQRKIYKLLDLNKDEIKKIPGNIKRTENLIEAVELAGI
ncbi:hypothetical protein SAMN04488034_104215 [Salinimicrobium catena]|uniref:Uncharacterized protein n=1 Tax=Salinimicrobium catena TaxID=390640 RepID=A0A1H5NIF3_9FLAO|nr:hypothetical protein [Salinimicrobium catena]SDL47479.1 hypothetical protein SAMN04488140_104215 [Salinimicrobium catena]SEF01355.1 hypothetical protein SAMN04488034_104215 [Salinimicrobium catena]